MKTICKAKEIKFIQKLYTDHNTLWVKHPTHEKAESLRATSLSNLNNIVNNNSIFNTKYAEFSTNVRWFFVFTTPLVHTTIGSVSTENLLLYLSQLSPLYLILTCSFPIFSSMPRQFLTSLLLRITIPTTYTKNIFLIFLNISASRDQGARQSCRKFCRESCEDWHCFNLSLLPQSMDSDTRITNSLLLGLRKLVYTVGVTSNPPALISYTYFHYVHTLLIPPKELSFPWKPVAKLDFSILIY